MRIALYAFIIIFVSGCNFNNESNPSLSFPDKAYDIKFNMHNYAPSQHGTQVEYRYEYEDQLEYGRHKWMGNVLDSGPIFIDFNRVYPNCSGRYLIRARKIEGEWRALYLAKGRRPDSVHAREAEGTAMSPWMTGNLPFEFASKLFPDVDRAHYVRRSVRDVKVDYNPLLDAVTFFDSIRVEAVDTVSYDACRRLVTLNPPWPDTTSTTSRE